MGKTSIVSRATNSSKHQWREFRLQFVQS